MNLKHNRKEGEFLNKSGEIICFDTSVYHKSESHLLIRKDPFLRYLQENNLRIAWAAIGEKQIIGDHASNHKRLDVTGFFCLEGDKVIGKTNR